MNPGKLLLTIAVMGLLLTACGGAPSAAPTPTAIPTVLADTAIITEGFVEPVRFAEIALNANGLISEVLVKQGESIQAGQVIARLESSEASTLADAQARATDELTAAYQGVRDAQYKLDNFDIPSDFAGMTPTQAVASMLEKLNGARSAYEPYKHLGPQNNTGREYKKRLDSAWAKYRRAIQWMELESGAETARARLEDAQKNYGILQDASFTEETAGARAALANAEVRAPFSGIITNLSLKVGEFASAGKPVVTIADTSSWVVKTTDLTEIDVVELAEGDPVIVTLDAIPGVEFRGNVLSIGQNFSRNQGDVVYEVTVLLTDSRPSMRWGMTAEVKFEN